MRYSKQGFGARTWRHRGWCPTFILVAVLLIMPGCRSEETPGRDEASPPAISEQAGFVDSRLCADCHQEQYRQWLGSHHDLAMQEASPETVLGDFDDSTFSHFGVVSTFYRKDGRFFVRTEGPEGKLVDFEVKYTFGVDPLQQYLIEFPGGRLQCLTVAWDTRAESWFHLYPDQRIAPGDPLHWTGRYQNWNLMCAECHSTNLEKNYDPATDSYRTTYHEIDVGCQACHGPGEAHVRWAGGRQSGTPRSQEGSGLAVDFAAGSARFEVEACAPCHSRRSRITPEWRHQGPIDDHFRVALLNEGLYYPDGQILDEVYVYGSFLQSRMYQRGVRCSDCHEPHTLRLKLDGDALCTRCHQLAPPEDFPSLKPRDYASPGHHFHPSGSEASRCVSCHMPQRTYMVVDPRRDHSFRMPRPDLSARLETPNPCNGCHSNRSPQWAQSKLEQWYGPQRTSVGPHYGETLAAGRRGDAAAGPALVRLVGESGQPAIVRATALDLLRGYRQEGRAAAVSATRDDEPLVRVAALSALELLAPVERVGPAAPLLTDPIRSVRIEAGRVLAAVPEGALSASQARNLRAALEEFEQAQLAIADTPWGEFNLGVLHQARGRVAEAERAYRRAIQRDAGFIPASANLATLLNQQGRNPEAEQVLREAIARAGEQGEVWYSLGLLQAEMGRLEEAAESLGRAVRLMPERARAMYNYGLALQQMGRRREAEEVLNRAYQLDPGDGEILYALVVFYTQDRKWSRAQDFLKLLRDQNPEDPRLAQIEEQIQQMLKGR